MADLIAILALGVQYSMVVVAILLLNRTTLSPLLLTIAFLILAAIGFVLWHREEPSQTVRRWWKLAVGSVVLGVGFFGVDFLVALSQGQPNPFHFPGGLLGLPVTLFICPGGTIVCFAGLVRTYYLSRKAAGIG